MPSHSMPVEQPDSPQSPSFEATVIIVGAGLAGLTAAHAALQLGSRVILLDKRPRLGGNSIKASSGINGVPTRAQRLKQVRDSVEAFNKDTTVSAGPLARPDLIATLTASSASALAWLESFGLDFDVVVRLGGHSFPRSHRPHGGPPGYLITTTLQKALEDAASQPQARVRIRANAKVVDVLEAEDGSVAGVEVQDAVTGAKKRLLGKVIVASGGFSTDVHKSGLIAKHRPDLLSLPTTSGDHTTGDLHKILSTRAALVDLDQVQVHPTGFLDPADIHARTKILAAEALRGSGAILVDAKGRRFVNELGQRDHVTSRIQKVLSSSFGPIRMILNADAFSEVAEHGAFYLNKGLMRQHENIMDCALQNGMDVKTLAHTLQTYEASSAAGHDEFGKMYFHNTIFTDNRPVYSALITPVIHYCMGGLLVDEHARVKDKQGNIISNLYACGEATGRVHGANRLGGSSLLECVVFGRLAAESAIKSPSAQ